MKFKHLLLIIILAAGIFVRLYNYANRVTFGPEQAVSLITSGRMITEKFSFLGEQNMQRVTASGHSFFSGAIFSYSLIPLQLLFNFDAFWITFYFTLLNLFTGGVLFFVTRRMLGEETALLTMILFLFSSISIYHSLFLWDQNYSFLLGALTIYLVYLFKNQEKFTTIFLLGFVSGVAYSIQDLYAISTLVVFAIVLKTAKQRFLTGTVFALGLVLANLPAIIFDIRHNFYYLNTYYEYLMDILNHSSRNASITYYHFLIFVPGLAILGGLLLKKIYIKSRLFGVVIVLSYTLVNLNSPRINFNAPTGMPAELTSANIYKAAASIEKDKPDNFNVAVLVDFDTRGHVLRYPLEFKYKMKPLDVVSYPESNVLYVLSENNYDFAKSRVWELSSFDKEHAVNLAQVSQSYAVFKLVK
jgi:hypothetical protein